MRSKMVLLEEGDSAPAMKEKDCKVISHFCGGLAETPKNATNQLSADWPMPRQFQPGRIEIGNPEKV